MKSNQQRTAASAKLTEKAVELSDDQSRWKGFTDATNGPLVLLGKP